MLLYLEKKMNELYKYIDEFKEALEKEQLINELKNSYKIAYKDKELIKQIKEYKEQKNYTQEENISNNSNYQRIKHLEAQLGFMILEINKKLKKITKKEEENESN